MVGGERGKIFCIKPKNCASLQSEYFTLRRRVNFCVKLLGISAITYVLAAAIVITLGLNIALGPGWLGQAIGLSGTGSFTETSGAIPESVDLSDPVYLL